MNLVNKTENKGWFVKVIRDKWFLIPSALIMILLID